MIPTPSTGNDNHDIREVEMHLNNDEVDLKRPLEYVDMRVPKKMRMDNNPAHAGIP
jgi:hypothetical protein